MIPLALLESPVEPPPLLLPSARPGVAVMVALPVVLTMVDAEVEVKDDTTPSCVVTMTVTTCRVDVLSRAEVIVVLEVLLVGLLVDSDVFDVAAVEVELVDTSDVVSLVDVVLLVKVVGVLFDVDVDVSVMTEDDVIVVLDGAAVVGEDVLAAAAVEPVPAACLLWNTPSMMGFPAADAVATRARRESVSRAEKYIVAQRSGVMI